MADKLEEINEIYSRIKPEITARISEFKKIWKKSTEEDIFGELVFCIMTPQSKAKSCGRALEILKNNDLVLNGSADKIAEKINIVRFRNNKASYIVAAREMFTENGRISIKKRLTDCGSPKEIRNWLAGSIKGIGYKEASHFLRNVGFGSSLAILDRHILKNMVQLSIIDSIPKTITPKMYFELEDRLLEFAERNSIPADHLDFVLWYKEAGEVYK